MGGRLTRKGPTIEDEFFRGRRWSKPTGETKAGVKCWWQENYCDLSIRTGISKPSKQGRKSNLRPQPDTEKARWQKGPLAQKGQAESQQNVVKGEAVITGEQIKKMWEN